MAIVTAFVPFLMLFTLHHASLTLRTEEGDVLAPGSVTELKISRGVSPIVCRICNCG